MADTKLIANFRKWADALTAKIDHLSRPLTQNPTPKRNREFQSRLHEARNMERFQKALRALATQHENGAIPYILTDLRDKETIRLMVRKGLSSNGGYYSVIENNAYTDTSEAARMLQKISEGSSEEEAERNRLRKIGELEAEVKLAKIPGYFPTPKEVAEQMVRSAAIVGPMTVLEPSAGHGAIADAIRESHPDSVIHVCEINPRLQEICKLKNYRLVATDFTDFIPAADLPDTEYLYDRIIMNPPFGGQADIDHVWRAYQHLRDGGRMVAIMSPSFEFRDNKKSLQFREWLDDVNASWHSLPSGSFKSSGTGVETRMLIIDRPLP